MHTVNLLATIRRKHDRAVARVLCLFVVMWLGLVLPPCAAAMDAESAHQHHCPQCPPAETHDQHVADATTDDLAASDMPCSPDAAHCAIVDDNKYDGRSPDVRIKDLPNVSPIAIASPLTDSVWYSPASATLIPPESAILPGTVRALNILYCVYLK
jgi:hypothetical protein